MADLFTDYRTGLESPARNAYAVTPDDGTDLTMSSRALWVGAAGNVSVILVNDSGAVTIVGVPAGSLLPFAVKRVRSTGTTAASIVALY